jgi:hypothetical protein
MKLFRKMAGVVVFAAIFAVTGSWAVASDSSVDRSALIEKISGTLKTEAVAKSFVEKGVDIKQVISKLDSLSDAQLVKLAEQTPSNLSQVGGELNDSGVSSFWSTWGLIMLIGILVPFLLIAGA